MSKHNDIYNILGKLTALTEKEIPAATIKAEAKKIYESVEARGSITSGVGAVEAKLKQQFAESEKWIQGAHVKKGGLHKALHVPQGETIPKGKIEKASHSKNAHLRHMAQFAKNVSEDPMGDVEGGTVAETEAFISDDVWLMAKRISKMYGKPVEEFGPEEVEEIANSFGLNTSDVVEILELNQANETMDGSTMGGAGVVGEESLDENGLQRYTGIKKYGKKGFEALQKAGREGASEEQKGRIKDKFMKNESMEEDTCNECGSTMESCGCDHEQVDENGISVRRHTGTYGTEYDGDDKPVAKVKQGRGRPKNPENDTSSKFDLSALNSVFGPKSVSSPVTGKKVLGKAMSHPANNIKDELDESLRSLGRRLLEGVNFKRHMEETQMSLDEMLGSIGEDLRLYKESGVMTDLLRDCMDIHSITKRQLADEAVVGQPSPTAVKMAVPAVQRKAAAPAGDKSWMIGQHDFDQQERESPTTRAGLAQRTRDLGLAEAELNELARLAGLPVRESNFSMEEEMELEGAGVMHYKAQKAKEQGKDSFTLGDKEFPVDESEMEEGNAFSGALAKAKAQHKDTFNVDGEEYDVTEADVSVEEPIEPENEPEEKYFNMKSSTLVPGEGDSGEKRMSPDRPTFKNGDNALSRPPVRETLEARLQAEYDSIKKAK